MKGAVDVLADVGGWGPVTEPLAISNGRGENGRPFEVERARSTLTTATSNYVLRRKQALA